MEALTSSPELGPLVPGEGPPNAKIFILGEAPGPAEIAKGRPFCGSSGYELDLMLREAGISRSECFCANVLPWQPPLGDLSQWYDPKLPKPHPDWVRYDGLWISPEVIKGLARVEQYLDLVKPKVVIALGNLAMWALTRKWGVASWRGSTLEHFKRPDLIVVPARTPADILRQYSWRIFSIWDFTRAKRAADEGVPRPDYSFLIRPTFTQACEWLGRLEARLAQGPVPYACDIETRAGHTACIGFATSKTEALCIPLMAQGHSDYSYWTLEQESFLTGIMRRILVHTNSRVYGQNFSYDAQYLWRFWRVVPRLGMDTLLASHVLFPGLEKSLDVLSSLYCENHVYWKDDGKEWHNRMDESVLWSYNCVDCVRTFEIAENLTALIAKSGLEEQCLFLHRMWHRAFDAMVKGVAVDHDNKAQFGHHLEEEGAKRLVWLTETLGFPINPRSPKQMKDLFYDLFGQKPILGPKRRPTTNDDALSKIAEREPLLKPVVRRIQEYRSIGVFKSTFLDAPVDVDKRLRTQYNVAGPETYRLSSSTNVFGSGLNLQNVPSGDEEMDLPNVRKIFIPDPGMEIADMDLSSADLHVVVWESEEEYFKTLLRSGKDPYTEIAKEYYHDESITKSDFRRKRFKALAHGTNYGGKPRGLSGRVGLREADVTRTQQWYFERFPKIKLWQDEVLDQLHSTKQIRNKWGYRRVYFDRIEGTVFNQALAWIGQSTVAILINKIWDAIADQEPWIEILLQVHDSLVFQYPIERASEARQKIISIAQSIAVPYADPLVIPVGLKTSQTSWGDCA